MLEKPLTWHSSSISHIGCVRSNNEDAYLDAREQGLWAVADGMGGYAAGDQASQTVVENLLEFSRLDDLPSNIDDLEDRVLNANRDCLKRAGGKKMMGSTVAILFAYDPFCFFIWVGDSRIYRLRNGQLTRVSEDHSLVQEMHALGEITLDEADVHPSSNIITRAIGVRKNVFVDVEYATVEPGDRFMLCSDGLYKDIRDDEICEMMNTETPVEQVTQNMLETALERGGGDNITIIVVQAEYM